MCICSVGCEREVMGLQQLLVATARRALLTLKRGDSGESLTETYRGFLGISSGSWVHKGPPLSASPCNNAFSLTTAHAAATHVVADRRPPHVRAEQTALPGAGWAHVDAACKHWPYGCEPT